MLKNLDLKQIAITMVVTMGSIAVYDMVVKPMIAKKSSGVLPPVIPVSAAE